MFLFFFGAGWGGGVSKSNLGVFDLQIVRGEADVVFFGGGDGGPQNAVEPLLLEPFKEGLGPNKYPRDTRCLWG